MRASSALPTSFHMPKPSQLGIFRLSFGTGALFLPTSRSCVFCISFGGFQNAQPAPEQKQRCKSICKFSSKQLKKDQAGQSIHMRIISAWEGLCWSSQQALCVHALHGQATISIRPRKRAGSHCIPLTSGGKRQCTQGGKLWTRRKYARKGLAPKPSTYKIHAVHLVTSRLFQSFFPQHYAWMSSPT